MAAQMLVGNVCTRLVGWMHRSTFCTSGFPTAHVPKKCCRSLPQTFVNARLLFKNSSLLRGCNALNFMDVHWGRQISSLPWEFRSRGLSLLRGSTVSLLSIVMFQAQTNRCHFLFLPIFTMSTIFYWLKLTLRNRKLDESTCHKVAFLIHTKF